MKRKIAILAPTIVLTALFVSRPPRSADSQPFRTPPIVRDSGTEPSPVTDSDRDAKLDTISMKAAILKEKTSEIKQGSIELERATQKLLREVKKDKSDDPAKPVIIVKDVDTIVVKDSTCVYVHDNSLDKRSWWGKYFCLLKECTIHKKVKKFTSKIFKRGKS